MFIPLYNYKELTECISEGERIEAKVNSKKKDWSTLKKNHPGVMMWLLTCVRVSVFLIPD